MSLLEGLPSALIAADASGRVRYANERASEILHADRDELVGLRLEDVLAPIDRLEELVAEAAGDGSRASLTVDVPHVGPRELGVQLVELPPENRDEVATAIVFQDIERYLQLRNERDKLLKLATVGDVLPSILHELKNPLASITSAVELLVEEEPDGPRREDLHAILSEVRRMKLGFEGIGVVSRDLRSASCHAVDLALQQTAKVIRAKAERGGVELSCDVPSLPLLPLDPSVIRAIAFNLLNNALHASRSSGRVELRARLEDRGGLFVLVVEDTGAGMDELALASCTDLFFTTKESGSGIGLALCKTTVEEAGGTLEVDSKEGVGTTVTVCVPLPFDDKSH